jgi:F-type H+-transporting ATPase subunit b
MVLLLAFAESAIQLVPDGTIFFHIFLILLMVWVLNRTLFKPINQVLAERETQTEGSSSETQSIVSNMSQKTRDYERRLRDARTEGYQLLETQKLETLRDRERRISELKNEISSWSEARRAELKKESENARVSLEQNSRELAATIASRILKRPITKTL